MRRVALFILAVCLLMIMEIESQAGMGYPTFTDFARMRISTLSFFLVAFLFFSLLFHLCWHQLRSSFSNLPKLTFRQSMSMMFLWGLIFLVVLIMISGARELMTPGAWEKNGFTYQLSDEEPEKTNKAQNDKESSEFSIEKIESLKRLKAELMKHADKHSGRFPTRAEYESLPYELRKVPNTFGVTWVYLPYSNLQDVNRMLVYKPFADSEETTLCLHEDGSIRILTQKEFEANTN